MQSLLLSLLQNVKQNHLRAEAGSVPRPPLRREQERYRDLVKCDAFLEHASTTVQQALSISATNVNQALSSQSAPIVLYASEADRLSQLLREFRSILDIVRADEKDLRVGLMRYFGEGGMQATPIREVPFPKLRDYAKVCSLEMHLDNDCQKPTTF